jgi:hypothetical protein
MQRHIPALAAIPESGAPSPPDRGPGVNDASTSGGGTIRIADLRDLPPTVDIETAARILGCGRTLAYELVKRGEFPCRILRLGKRYLVPTASLLESLGLHAGNGSLARGDTDRAAV